MVVLHGLDRAAAMRESCLRSVALSDKKESEILQFSFEVALHTPFGHVYGRVTAAIVLSAIHRRE